MAASSLSTTVKATCLCGSFNHQIDFPTDSLPFDRALCLCTSCRHLSGSCGFSAIRLPFPPPSSSLENLTAYAVTSDHSFYFCKTCGAHVLNQRHDEGIWHISTGIWDKTEDVVRWTGCKWVEDTLDGGVSLWFNEVSDPDGTKRPLQRWLLQDGDGELVSGDTLRNLPKELKERRKNKDKLGARCHCGGVKFYIARPNNSSRAARSPFPDLMVPYHSHASANPDNQTWWLRRGDTKYMAGTCTCTSCRLSSGMEIQPWAFIPRCNIFQEDGKPLDFAMGTLHRHESSKDVYREFCRVCGASVFWHSEERPDLIDVSVGLFDAEEGARVEGWLDWWTERCSFEEMAVSRSLVSSLEAGLKAWKQEH